MTSSRGRKGRNAGDRHGPNSVDNYLKVHHARLNDLRDAGEVVRHSITEEWIGGELIIRGRVECRDNVYVDVDKKLEEIEPWVVRNRRYSYHAGVLDDEGAEIRSILRYDNAHIHDGHDDEHHRHCFDDETGIEYECRHVGTEGWPHLDGVIREALLWWDTVGQFLPSLRR